MIEFFYSLKATNHFILSAVKKNAYLELKLNESIDFNMNKIKELDQNQTNQIIQQKKSMEELLNHIKQSNADIQILKSNQLNNLLNNKLNDRLDLMEQSQHNMSSKLDFIQRQQEEFKIMKKNITDLFELKLNELSNKFMYSINTEKAEKGNKYLFLFFLN